MFNQAMRKIFTIVQKGVTVAREQGGRALLARMNRQLGLSPVKGTPTGYTCLRPYYYASIHLNGRVYCCCPGWVKFSLGTLTSRTPLSVLWNSRIAQTYRAAMHATELDRVCHQNICPHILRHRLPHLAKGKIVFDDISRGTFPADIIDDPAVIDALQGGARQVDYLPRSLEICADPRCNLSCVTCRDHRITHADPETERLLELVSGTIDNLAPELRHLELLGSGEAFYSPFCLELLRRLDRKRFPHLTVRILTNGQLLTPHMWEGLGTGAPFIREISVSIDAATKEMYERTRRGARWKTLLTNLGFLRGLRHSGAVSRTSINFVVTADNFREMPAFVRLGQEYAVDEIWFTTVLPFIGQSVDYRAAAVHLPEHPQNAALKTVLRDPAFEVPQVVLGLEQ